MGSSRIVLTLAVGMLLAACNGAATEGAIAAAAPASALTDPASGTDCTGNDLHITRAQSRLVIHGECRDVVISASNGALNLDKARSIRVEGSHFTVLNADAGAITVSGDHNTLNLTRAGMLDVSGTGNLALGQQIDSVSFSGHDNTVNVDNQPTLEDAGSGNRVI